MPENVTSETRQSRTKAGAPQPVAPVDGQIVHADAVPFKWEGSAGSAPYVFQISEDPEFDEVIATITAGDATALTLYDTLRVDDVADRYWRVRSEKGAWSAPGHFRAASTDHVQGLIAERDERAREASREAFERHLAQEERVPVAVPEDSGVSDRMTAVVLGVIVISFLVLLVILMIFGQVTYPSEAAMPGAG